MTDIERQGRLITFEGGEGAGKSTQMVHLRDRLSAAGVKVVTTRAPGGTPFAEQVREFILSPDTKPHAPLAEALLFTAARADHVETVIEPAIAAAKWVLCDRFTDSTRAYQGAAGGVDQEKLRVLENVVIGTKQPDLTFILDLPAQAGLARAGKRAAEQQNEGAPGDDPYEARDLAFHERLREGFLEIAREEPERCVIVDAQQSEKRITDKIWRIVIERLDLGES